MGPALSDTDRDRLMSARVEVRETSLKEELAETFAPVKALLVISDDPFREFRQLSPAGRVKAALFYVFPILEWVSSYDVNYLFGDIVAGLTIASLAVPQDLGYANLAHLPPINGLNSSFIPPLIYAVLGTSRHIAIGPVAVVSLLLGDLLTNYYDPDTEKKQYLYLAFTATFFAGVFQLGMGVFRLGFIIEFLSHAVVVGFMAGAAVTISLQQLKGLLGYSKFTTSTDVVSVLSYVFDHTNMFNWRSFLIGFSFLVFLLSLKFLSWRFKRVPTLGQVLFYMNATGPLLSVVISTAAVYGTGVREKPYNVATVKEMPKGLSHLSSLHHLQFSSEEVGKAAAVGLVAGLIALTEASAIARTFASLKGYHVDGNKEMIALGAMNLAGSVTSSYVTTGSFSRSAVNFNAGGETMLTNIVMSMVVLVTLVAITPVFKYLPQAVLASIIITAVIGLIDLGAVRKIWRADKVDLIVTLGTFLGIVFVSVEIGLLIGVAISMLKIAVQITRPHLATLGAVPGTGVWRNVQQYVSAETEEGVYVLRVDGPLYFPNASYVREKVLSIVKSHHHDHPAAQLTHFILDLTPVSDIDTTGIHALEELHSALNKANIQLGVSNPAKAVLRKLVVAGFIEQLGEEWLFLSAHEAAKSCRSFRDSGRNV